MNLRNLARALLYHEMATHKEFYYTAQDMDKLGEYFEAAEFLFDLRGMAGPDLLDEVICLREEEEADIYGASLEAVYLLGILTVFGSTHGVSDARAGDSAHDELYSIWRQIS